MMTNKDGKPKEERGDVARKPVPFDEALRRLVNAPPKHKPAKKPPPKKSK